MPSKNRTRTEIIGIRFTEKEMRDFNKAFEKSEFSNRTDFILGLMNNSKVYIFKYNLDILRNIQINLAQIGNNLNQIVRRIQTTDTMYKEDLDEINSQREKIKEIAQDFTDVKKRLPKREFVRRK